MTDGARARAAGHARAGAGGGACRGGPRGAAGAAARLLEREIVGVVPKRLLDLEGHRLEVEEEEGDARHGGHGGVAVGREHREWQRAQPEEQEGTQR